jgi:starch synthase
MSLSIITFADLGKKRSSKTPAILPVIKKFIQKGELKQIICRFNQDFPFKNTYSGLNVWLHYLLRGIERFLISSIPSREWEEFIFDYFASRKLRKSDAVLFHPARFSRTMEKARRNNSLIIGIGTTSHPKHSKRLEDEEYELLGLNKKRSFQGSEKEIIVNKFDYIIALSDFVKDSYIKYGFPKEKIFTASLDINFQRFKPLPIKKDDKFRAVYASSTWLLRGLHYLLDAWRKMSLENAELLVLGGYSHSSSLPQELKERYIKEINDSASIKYIGHVGNPEKYYNISSVFVLPSLSEGFPKVTLEAMACGLPVITTEHAKGIVENNKTGFIVPIRDSKAIQGKIEFLYNNSERRKEMGKLARTAAINKESFGDQVFEIYKKILKENKL